MQFSQCYFFVPTLYPLTAVTVGVVTLCPGHEGSVLRQGPRPQVGGASLHHHDLGDQQLLLQVVPELGVELGGKEGARAAEQLLSCSIQLHTFVIALHKGSLG